MARKRNIFLIAVQLYLHWIVSFAQTTHKPTVRPNPQKFLGIFYTPIGESAFNTAVVNVFRDGTIQARTQIGSDIQQGGMYPSCYGKSDIAPSQPVFYWAYAGLPNYTRYYIVYMKTNSFRYRDFPNTTMNIFCSNILQQPILDIAFDKAALDLSIGYVSPIADNYDYRFDVPMNSSSTKKTFSLVYQNSPLKSSPSEPFLLLVDNIGQPSKGKFTFSGVIFNQNSGSLTDVEFSCTNTEQIIAAYAVGQYNVALISRDSQSRWRLSLLAANPKNPFRCSDQYLLKGIDPTEAYRSSDISYYDNEILIVTSKQFYTVDYAGVSKGVVQPFTVDPGYQDVDRWGALTYLPPKFNPS